MEPNGKPPPAIPSSVANPVDVNCNPFNHDRTPLNATPLIGAINDGNTDTNGDPDADERVVGRFVGNDAPVDVAVDVFGALRTKLEPIIPMSVHIIST
jgi:hypothetical protein